MYGACPAAVNAWWQAIGRRLKRTGVAGVPQAIEWPASLDAHWRDPALLLSQTCGYCIVADLERVVQVVGAFSYTAPGAAGIGYRSELMVRDADGGQRLEDYRGRIAAYNEADSYSGWHSLRSLVAPLGGAHRFFASTVATGAHRGSLALLQRGDADIAAVDCITLAGLRRHAPHLVQGLRSVGHTTPAPGCPLVTSMRTSPRDLAALRRALEDACNAPDLAPLREALFIGGFTACDADAWNSMRTTCESTAVLEAVDA